MTCMGLVYDYSGLLTVRWFLGLTEAGLLPGVNYCLSCWYKRSECGVRAAVFFSAAALAGFFGGLLAAAIANMDGLGRNARLGLDLHHGGVGNANNCNCLVLDGNLAPYLPIDDSLTVHQVHDFPDEATFLSDEDRGRVIRRLKLDNQSSAKHEEFKLSYLWATLSDWKTYTGMIVYMRCDGLTLCLFPLHYYSHQVNGLQVNSRSTSQRPPLRHCSCDHDRGRFHRRQNPQER
jgi:MFS family permease